MGTIVNTVKASVFVAFIVFIAVFVGLGGLLKSPQAAADAPLADSCQWTLNDTAKVGYQHHALLVGINSYEAVTDLKGPENDVRLMKEYLTSFEGGPNVLPENVCVLTSGQATLKNTLAAFRALEARIDSDDHVTFYFAGHGSQLADDSGAELDGMDETLVLQDTRVPVPQAVDGQRLLIPHLTDDAFGGLLGRLNRKLTEGREGAHALTVVLDSCNSLSSTRGSSAARFVEPLPRLGEGDRLQSAYAPLEPYLREAGFDDVADTLEETDRGQSLTEAFPYGAVVLAAAGDGAAALEFGGYGAFTVSLLEVLQSARTPLTYQQLEWRIRESLMASHQVPAVMGKVDALVFSSELRGAVGGHTVSEVSGTEVQLVGLPVFGLGPDAEFRIYGGAGVAQQPDQAKAIVRITDTNALTPRAVIVWQSNDKPVEPGDVAVLISASPQARKLVVRLSPTLGPDLTRELINIGGDFEDVQRGVALTAEDDVGTEAAFDLKVSLLPTRSSDAQRLAIIDTDGRIRASYLTTQLGKIALVERLGSFSRQKSLRLLRSESGNLFEPGGGLSVKLEPVRERTRSMCQEHIPVLGEIREIDGLRFEVPLCERYRFAIEAVGLQKEIQVAILFLASDGTINVVGLGQNGESDEDLLRLSPYVSVVEPGNQTLSLPDVYQAYPPLVPNEDILVFAIDARTPMPWAALAESMAVRRSSVPDLAQENALYRELNSYMNVGLRSGPIDELEQAHSAGAWAVTRAELRAVAFPTLEPYIEVTSEEAAKREYTVSAFRIEPYLPVDNTSSLYRVLERANRLATKSHEFSQTNTAGSGDSAGEGYSYRQHDWCAADDSGDIDFEANLETGIDCSRAIWYAFTQAGLPYSRQSPESGTARMACLAYDAPGNDYLATADMARADSPLAEHFDRCDGLPLNTGDVLVYRDEDRRVGHTVMVIDPVQRIGWGSHGWDGEGRLTGTPDTGVEYQRIKVKQDWERWDSESMRLEACWRHRSFVAERAAGRLYTEGQWENILCPRGQICYAGPVSQGETDPG